MANLRGGVVFPHLSTLPGNKDGLVHYQGTGLWINDGAVWRQVGVNYRNFTAGRVQPALYTASATSDANGTFSLTLPTGYFASIHQAQATAFQPTASTSNAAYATITTTSITSITGRTWTSAGTAVLNLSLLTTNATVAPNVQVSLLVIGV